MKQLIFPGEAKVDVVEVDPPSPGPGEVVIEARASAICGSEMHAYKDHGCGEVGNGGHEGAGVVAALGEGVTTLAVGDRVGVSAVSGCGSCDYCGRGQYTWCANHKVYASMHAEQFLTHANACHRLPDDLPWGVAVLLTGDGLGVPYHTSRKLTAPDIRTIAVFGMGPIGLGHTIVQSHLGRRIIAIDVVQHRLQLARELGAVETVDASAGDVVEAVRELTDGRGADVCIEAAGRPQTAKACFSAVRTAGTVVFNGEQASVELSPSTDFIRRDITAVGAWFYHFCEYTEMLALYREGMPVDKLITHHFPLSEGAEAFRLFAAGQAGKVILEP
jgi:propanol-preferring alcohol dehydrogenase